MATLAEERQSFEARLKALFEAALTDTQGDGTIPGIPVGGLFPTSRIAVINYIKAKLDELLPQVEGLTFQLSQAPNVTNWLDLIISTHLEESVKHVILTAPKGSVWPSRLNITEGVADVARPYTGYIPLPDSFLLLSSLRMYEWHREVTRVYTTRDAIYNKQSFQGLRGGLVKPLAFLAWRTIGYANQRVLEYYSVKTSHNIDYLYYLHTMLAEDFVAKNPNLYDSLAWMCAQKVLQITNQKAAAEMATEQVKLSYTKIQ